MRALSIAVAFALLFAAGASPAADGTRGICGYTDEEGVLRLTDMPDDPRFELLLGEHDGTARVVGTKLLAMKARPFHAEIVAAARTHRLEPALLHAVISAESAYRAHAVSRKGARGLMQVMPATALRYGVGEGSLGDPAVNIGVGARYLADLIGMFAGDLSLALAAYNAGENAVLRHGRQVPPYAETRAYVPQVLKVYNALAGR